MTAKLRCPISKYVDAAWNIIGVSSYNLLRNIFLDTWEPVKQYTYIQMFRYEILFKKEWLARGQVAFFLMGQNQFLGWVISFITLMIIIHGMGRNGWYRDILRRLSLFLYPLYIEYASKHFFQPPSFPYLCPCPTVSSLWIFLIYINFYSVWSANVSLLPGHFCLSWSKATRGLQHYINFPW